MELVYNLLVVLHLLGWAIVLGGTLVNLRTPRSPRGCCTASSPRWSPAS